MNILVIDDESSIQTTMAMALRTMGHTPFSAYSGSQALRKLNEQPIDAAFLDLRLGSESGIDVYDAIRAEKIDIPIVMFTAYSSIETAINATRKGVFDYMLKPLVPEQIQNVLERIDEARNLEQRINELETQIKTVKPSLVFESSNDRMQAAYALADKAAPSDATVLLLGQSGTGKTVIARRIHEKSGRAAAPFVVIHCPSLSKELLESELFGHVKGAFTGAVSDTWGKVSAAEEGTLFLDEIGDLPMEIQAKLLRLLQERQYERIGEAKTRKANLRLIAATNKDLYEEAQKGNFREDLYYRLNVIPIVLPSLSERRDDIPTLASLYLEHHAIRLGNPALRLTDAAIEAMLDYDWPGNLRELYNTIERCVILAGDKAEIDVFDLPSEISTRNFGSSEDAHELRIGGISSLEAIEEEHIKRVLTRCQSAVQASRILGINITTLYRKRKRMALV